MPTSAADLQRISERYPRPRSPRWFVAALAAIALTAGLAWLIPTAWYHSNPAVSGDIIRFQVQSNSTATFTIAVQRTDPQRAARCHVIAVAENHERVGEVTVDVVPATATVVDVHHNVPTFRRATSVEVKSCTSV